MAQGRYQFEGQTVNQPNANVGSVDLGSLYSSFRPIDHAAWQTQDEQIQLDLLKGAPVTDGFNRYMQLAQIAGAAGDHLASITFQQKAYSLQNAASGGGGRGRGRGGSGGSGSGTSATAVKGAIADSLDALKTQLLPQLQDEIKQIAEAIKSGAVAPSEGMQDIASAVGAYQQKAIELYTQFSQFVGQKGYSGIKSDLNAIAKEAGIGLGANDGAGSKAVNAALKDNLYGNTVADGNFIGQLSEDFGKVTGPDAKNFVMTLVPQGSSEAQKLNPNATKQTGIVFAPKDLAESAGYIAVPRIGAASQNGQGVPEYNSLYVKPSSTSSDSGNNTIVVPSYDRNLDKTVNRVLSYNPTDKTFTENGTQLPPDFVLYGRETSSTNAPFPGASLDTSFYDQQNKDQASGGTQNDLLKKIAVGSVYASPFGTVPVLADVLKGKRNFGTDLNTIKNLFSTQDTTDLQGNVANTFQGLLNKISNNQQTPQNPVTQDFRNFLTPQQPTLQNQQGNGAQQLQNIFSQSTLSPLSGRMNALSNLNPQAPTPQKPDMFQSIIDSLVKKNQPKVQPRRNIAPATQNPQSPFFGAKAGVGGAVKPNPFQGIQGGAQGRVTQPVTQAANTRQDPLGFRNNASMAALNGFQQFSKFIRGLF